MAVNALPDFAHMWSLLDATGPHFLTYVYSQYNRQLETFDLAHILDHNVYLAPAEFFYPNRDPDKYSYFYSKCKGYERLNSLQKAACQNLKATPPEKERMAIAFTDHHWIHTYLTVKISLRGPVPIHSIVPNAKIYSKEE